MRKRFAVVKLWPGLNTAEDECIARLRTAAGMIGVECVAIYADGRYVEDEEKTVSRDNVDFVIHLHYDTPKSYDVFSFVALWNPVMFYHQWGYERCSRNLLTHDDFLSCGSIAADAHVARMVRRDGTHLPARFTLYHSVSDTIHEPTLGAHRLFYAGINWDVIVGGKSRHQELLRHLDGTGILRIYGPTIFHGHRVWDGYRSYVREVPFDGVSMIDEIADAGIALVLSSEAHKDSELMSSRLFESVAAGALVICDENGFAKRNFGDSLLYVDTRLPARQVARTIVSLVNWAAAFPEEALAKARAAQEIFRRGFTLKRSLETIYAELPHRQAALAALQFPPSAPAIPVHVYFFMPDYGEALLRRILKSIAGQTYEDFHPVVVVDRQILETRRDAIATFLSASRKPVEIVGSDFYLSSSPKKPRRRLGSVILELLGRGHEDGAAVVFVGPNEQLLSNHLLPLAGYLAKHPDAACQGTWALLRGHAGAPFQVQEKVRFLTDGEDDTVTDPPIGFGRFMFRLSALPDDIGIALPFLDDKALAVLIGQPLDLIPAASVVIDTSEAFPPDSYKAEHQIEVIAAYAPKVLATVGKPRREPAKKSEEKAEKHVTCRVYEPLESGYEEGRSLPRHVQEGTWQRIRLACDLHNPALGIRFDPAEEPCIIDVVRVRLRSTADERSVLWRAQGEALNQLTVAGTARPLRHGRTLQILSFGEDPQIIIPALASLAAEETIDVEVLMRVSRDLSPVGAVFDELGTFRTLALGRQAAGSAEADHLREKEDRIAALETSLSWRITAPLRKASQMLRR